MRYGSDRGRFHEMTGKRAVEDKNIGPLIKVRLADSEVTVMILIRDRPR